MIEYPHREVIFTFKFLKRRHKNENSVAFRREMAKKLDGKHIKYVGERINNEEIIIGREGGLNLRNGEMIVFASGIVVFRAEVDDLLASELMSGDGVILTAHDLEHDGVYRSVVAYYSYYRK